MDFTGQAVPLEELLELCHENGLVLIEDGAHSIGTKYKGRPVGSIADMTTFSFHPVKTVTGGEGGAVLTNRKDLYEKLLLCRSHGITKDAPQYVHESHGPWYHEQIDLGYNYRITDIQCALILSQLDKLGQFAARRSSTAIMRLFHRYRSSLYSRRFQSLTRRGISTYCASNQSC